MSHQNQPEKKVQHGPNMPDLNEEIIKTLLENQKVQLLNESEQLKLKHREIGINGKLAERSLELQAQQLFEQAHEGRKM